MNKYILYCTALISILFLTRCAKDVNPDLLKTVFINKTPELITNSISQFTDTSAISGGKITNDGGAKIITTGICWSTSPNPSINNTHTTDSLLQGGFTSKISSLIQVTKYYVRAYATNSMGISYGNELSFTTTGKIIDYDGNVYNTVIVGTQIWLKQNLNTTHYCNGDAIPNVTDITTWSHLATGAYCNYDNNASNATIYGRLYNWYTVNTANLCPTGWHVPSDVEWTTLTTYLGGESIAGGKLKEAGLNHWQNPNIAATNETGFTALPSGLRGNNGNFNNIASSGYWWSSTENSISSASSWYIFHEYSNIGNDNSIEQMGFSVRCVKD